MRLYKKLGYFITKETVLITNTKDIEHRVNYYFRNTSLSVYTVTKFHKSNSTESS